CLKERRRRVSKGRGFRPRESEGFIRKAYQASAKSQAPPQHMPVEQAPTSASDPAPASPPLLGEAISDSCCSRFALSQDRHVGVLARHHKGLEFLAAGAAAVGENRHRRVSELYSNELRVPPAL